MFVGWSQRYLKRTRTCTHTNTVSPATCTYKCLPHTHDCTFLNAVHWSEDAEFGRQQIYTFIFRHAVAIPQSSGNVRERESVCGNRHRGDCVSVTNASVYSILFWLVLISSISFSPPLESIYCLAAVFKLPPSSFSFSSFSSSSSSSTTINFLLSKNLFFQAMERILVLFVCWILFVDVIIVI